MRTAQRRHNSPQATSMRHCNAYCLSQSRQALSPCLPGFRQEVLLPNGCAAVTFADSACIPRYRQHHCATARQIAYRRVVRRSYQVYRVLDIKNRPLETTKHLLATYLFFLSNTMLSLSCINKHASHPHLTRK